MIEIGQNFVQNHPYTPTVSVVKVSLFMNRLVYIDDIYYIW